MWEGGVRIYDYPEVPNKFPMSTIFKNEIKHNEPFVFIELDFDIKKNVY